MIDILAAQAPRIIYVAFSVYALFVLIARWRVTRVMTQDRRFLFLFFVMELTASILSGVTKALHDAHLDVSSWVTVLAQGYLAAYLYHSIPASFRRAHHRWTRRPHKEV